MQEIHNADPRKIIICMVGLPARGKSYIAKKIARFVNWLGFPTAVFNIGNYRRKYMEMRNIPLSAEYFNNDDHQTQAQREEIALLTMRDLAKYINEGQGSVAILDGTNSTKSRRRKIQAFLQQNIKHKYYLFMVESICDDPKVIQENVKKVKVHNPDFTGMQPEDASQQFFKRIEHYNKYYESCDNSEGFHYMKTINIGHDFVIHGVRGYLQEKIVTYVMNLTISPNRIIYLIRHGESMYNVEDRVGGDSNLTQKGIGFAKSLHDFFIKEIDKEEASILTSTLKRTIQTASYIDLPGVKPISLKVLDEINAGVCQTLTYEEIEKKYPEAHFGRMQDKLKYRYPSGESYLDLISRLEPVIHWIERQVHPIIVVAHQAVLRCIYAYFFKTDIVEIPHIPITLHSIIKLVPETYFFNERHYQIDPHTNKVVKEVERKHQKSVDVPHNGEKLPTIKKMKKVESVPVDFKLAKRF